MSITVELFKAEWCGHCQNFKPEWEKLQKKCQDKNLKCKTFDDENNADDIQGRNIRSYPTVMITTQNKNAHEYNGEMTADAILEYIDNLKTQKGGSNQNQCGGGTSSVEVDYKKKYWKYKHKYLQLLATL